MQRAVSILILVVGFISVLETRAEIHPKIEYKQGDYQFSWNTSGDSAQVLNLVNKTVIWKGGLLPSFWVQDKNGDRMFLEGSVSLASSAYSNGQGFLELTYGDIAKGEITIETKEWGISLTRFSLEWKNEPLEIIEMYFGAKRVPADRRSSMPVQDRPFWASWSSEGFCVPGAKEGPVQSYFRMWDFGQSNIALGSFAPSMGTPYGAAFPRPVLFFAMGSDNGWVTFGTGNLPDAPMSLKVETGLGCIQYLYREDLWGAGGAKRRIWENPLRISFGKKAYQGFQNYYASFEQSESKTAVEPKSMWNTWGDWRHQKYVIQPIVDFLEGLEADIFVTDDPWEESQGSGTPSLEKFPDFYKDLEYIRENGMGTGLWSSLAWVENPEKLGLTKDDLFLGKDGTPIRASWIFNPFSSDYYCLDISSPRSLAFLKNRTISIMKNLKPEIIKMDFGYGVPNPNMGVPRNPQLRGERYCYELLKTVAETAKSVNPEVSIMYYGIHPFFLTHVDIVSLDDQGDMWFEVKKGHDQWSLWASLLSDRDVVLSGSSGYDWTQDDEVILNSFVLGTPGSVLATSLDDGSPVPSIFLNRRLALYKWFRRTVNWNPLWLDSKMGGLNENPELNCWGRLENINGKNALTSLVLRSMPADKGQYETLKPFDWEGRWAVVTQDQKDVTNSTELALIPFDPGHLSIKLPSKPDEVRMIGIGTNKVTKNWKWNEGKLTVHMTSEDLSSTAGFVIKQKKD